MNALSLFDSIFNNQLDNDVPAFCSKAYRSPRVDVTETNTAYNLEMELPGFTNDDINIELDSNKLTIESKETSETKEEKSDSNDEIKYLIKERHGLNFSRSFTLPDNAELENISANFKNGILFIAIPKKEIAAPRKIAINVA